MKQHCSEAYTALYAQHRANLLNINDRFQGDVEGYRAAVAAELKTFKQRRQSMKSCTVAAAIF